MEPSLTTAGGEKNHQNTRHCYSHNDLILFVNARISETSKPCHKIIYIAPVTKKEHDEKAYTLLQRIESNTAHCVVSQIYLLELRTNMFAR